MSSCDIREERCDAARQIESQFGTEKALEHLIGEEFLIFLEAAETDSDFRAEIPAFVAGIKTILVELTDTKILKKFSFTKPGPQTKKISGLKVNTKGLAPGVFTIKIAVTDQRGTHRSIIRRFAICKPVPVFTG